MEKIKSNLPLGVLLSYIIKILVTGPSISDAAIIIALIGLCAYFRKLQEDEAINSYKIELQKLEEKHKVYEQGLREIQLALGSTKLINSVKTFQGTNGR